MMSLVCTPCCAATCVSGIMFNLDEYDVRRFVSQVIGVLVIKLDSIIPRQLERSVRRFLFWNMVQVMSLTLPGNDALTTS